jgi:hypothetical protein
MNAQEILRKWTPELTETMEMIFQFVFKNSEHEFNKNSEFDETNFPISEIVYLYILRIFGVD